MKTRLSILFLGAAILLGLVLSPGDAVCSETQESKAYKFKPVHSEDWPETGEAEGGNHTSTDDDGEGDGRQPASTGMPDMKMNPDGTIDPSSFKKFF
jgi:hypothetical protein